MAQKDIIFYSNYCDFCKEVLTVLVKNNLNEQFMNVCVDNKNLKLPSFVDRVPLVYTTNKKLVADEEIMKYIQSKISACTLQPFALMGMSCGGLSESFSFLNQDEDETASRNFIYIGSEQKINAPDENDKGFSKDNEKVLESYLAERDMDLKKMFGNRPQMRM